jgi:hypothetical protein
MVNIQAKMRLKNKWPFLTVLTQRRGKMNFSCKLEKWKTENKFLFFNMITSEGQKIYPSYVRIRFNTFRCLFLWKNETWSLPFRNETHPRFRLRIYTKHSIYPYIFIYLYIYVAKRRTHKRLFSQGTLEVAGGNCRA